MKQLSEFFKTTLVGGLFVLVPLLLLNLFISEILDLIVALATPVADLFPAGTFDEIRYPTLWALILLVGLSFALGLASRSALGRSVGGWIERTLLTPLPAYEMLKNVTRAFSAGTEGSSFQPALLLDSDGSGEIAYVVEELGNGQVTVLLPWSPAAFAGALKVVPRERIRLLDASLGDVSRAVSLLGVGTREILGRGGAAKRG